MLAAGMRMGMRMLGFLTRVSQLKALLGSAEGNPLPTWVYPLSLGKKAPSDGRWLQHKRLFPNFPGVVWKIHLWKLQVPTPSASQALFWFLPRTNQKNREGKRGMRNRAGMECSNCTPRNSTPWFVQAAFKPWCIHEESPSVMKKKKGKENMDWERVSCAWKASSGTSMENLHHSTALECHTSLLHLCHSLPWRAGENTRLFWCGDFWAPTLV